MNCKKKLERNIGLDYVFCFIRSFDLSSAIWVLYMVYKGLPLWQVGIAEGVFHIASFLFEVPTGALADLFGRKNIMIAGRVVSAVSCIIMLFAGSLPEFCLSFIFSALSYNLNSGSEEALVYDSMKVIGNEEGYLRVNGRLNVIIEVSQGISTFIGGVLAEKSYFLCYLMAIVIAGLSLIPVFVMEEPPIRSEKEEEKVTLRKHFKRSMEAIRQTPAVIRILIYYPVVEAFYVVLYFYGQQYFSEYGFDKVEISLIMLFASGLSCLGALYSERALNRFKENTKYVASVVMGIGILLVSVDNVVVSIGAFAVASFVNSLLYPIKSAALNTLIPSEQRATILSVDSMCFSIAMILFFPLSGAVATMMNLHVTFFILGLVETVMVVLLVKRK